MVELLSINSSMFDDVHESLTFPLTEASSIKRRVINEDFTFSWRIISDNFDPLAGQDHYYVAHLRAQE